MIQYHYTYACCGSKHIVKNEHNKSGLSNSNVVIADAPVRLNPKLSIPNNKKQFIIKNYLERGSLRAMQRLFGVAPATLTGWIKKISRWKSNPIWTWIALCRSENYLTRE